MSVYKPKTNNMKDQHFENWKEVEQAVINSKTSLTQVVERFHQVKKKVFPGKTKFAVVLDTQAHRTYNAIFQYLHPRFRV